eukprot:4048617-Amphidinium_carterae.2
MSTWVVDITSNKVVLLSAAFAIRTQQPNQSRDKNAENAENDNDMPLLSNNVHLVVTSDSVALWRGKEVKDPFHAASTNHE